MRIKYDSLVRKPANDSPTRVQPKAIVIGLRHIKYDKGQMRVFRQPEFYFFKVDLAVADNFLKQTGGTDIHVTVTVFYDLAAPLGYPFGIKIWRIAVRLS